MPQPRLGRCGSGTGSPAAMRSMALAQGRLRSRAGRCRGWRRRRRRGRRACGRGRRRRSRGCTRRRTPSRPTGRCRRRYGNAQPARSAWSASCAGASSGYRLSSLLQMATTRQLVARPEPSQRQLDVLDVGAVVADEGDDEHRGGEVGEPVGMPATSGSVKSGAGVPRGTSDDARAMLLILPQRSGATVWAGGDGRMKAIIDGVTRCGAGTGRCWGDGSVTGAWNTAWRPMSCRQSVRAQLRRLLWESFPDDFTEDDWQHGLGGVHVVAFDGERPVGHASVVSRTLYVGEQRYRRRLPRGRRRRPGLSRTRDRCVRRADGRPGASPSGTRSRPCRRTEHGFYERLGWERWRGPSSVVSGGGWARTEDEDDGVMVLRAPGCPVTDLTVPIAVDERVGDSW